MMNWYWGGGWLGMSAMVLGWVGALRRDGVAGLPCHPH